MARIEHIHLRLVKWGAWKVRRADTGLGYPRVNILLSMGCGGASGYREVIVPIDEAEAAETDRAVESLRLVKSHLYLTLQLVYVRNIGVTAAARHMQRSRASVHAQLEQADAEVAAWLEAKRAERRERGFTP